MSSESAQQRIELLLAHGHAKRLAVQLALLDARDQLVPLRGVAALFGAIGRAAGGAGAAPLLGALAKIGRGHPWLASASLGAAARWLIARPRWLLIGAAVFGLWWLVRPPAAEARDESRAAP